MNEAIDRKLKSTKETKKTKRNKISNSLKKYFELHEMVFYQRSVDKAEIFLLPYRIKKQNIRFEIRIIVFDEVNLSKMEFNFELNNDRDYSKELLNINDKLIMGRLSVAEGSDQVTYTVDFNMSTKADIEKEYTQYLEMGVGVLAMLYEKKIVKTDE